MQVIEGLHRDLAMVTQDSDGPAPDWGQAGTSDTMTPDLAGLLSQSTDTMSLVRVGLHGDIETMDLLQDLVMSLVFVRIIRRSRRWGLAFRQRLANCVSDCSRDRRWYSVLCRVEVSCWDS